MNKENPVPECQKAIQQDQLFREVLDVLQPWTLEKKNDPNLTSSLIEGIRLAESCFRTLGRTNEIDAYFEQLAAVYSDDWRVLSAVAELINNLNHNGAMIDNVFQRGVRPSRVSAAKRDRVRAIQLMMKAFELVEIEYAKNKSVENATTNSMENDICSFYHSFALCFETYPSWKMQILTDYSTLPDYEDYNRNDSYDMLGGMGRIGGGQGRYNNFPLAPVDEKGNPIFYFAPERLELAKNDGERWRYLYERACSVCPSNSQLFLELANFAQRNFGIQTLQNYDYFSRNDQTLNENDDATDGVWSLHTLQDDETIARLANGIKRFKLPKEYSPLALYREAINRETQKNNLSKVSIQLNIVTEYVNRRQYNKAVSLLEEIFAEEKISKENNWGNRGDRSPYRQLIQTYEQLVKNWGRFEPKQSEAYKTDISLPFLFRNGSSVSFVAYEVRVPELLNDIKEFLPTYSKKGISDKLNQINPEQLGLYLVNNEETREKYLGKQVAQWEIPLEPLAGHYDRRVNIDFPIKDSGAYLVESTMKDGNRDSILVWINDSVIIQKEIDKAIYYFVADAKTGAPIPNAKIDIFGYKLVFGNNRNIPIIKKTQKIEKTDEKGQFIFKDQNNLNENVLITATTPDTADSKGRFAYLGFSSYWIEGDSDEDYHQVRAYFVSDRPVYRPNQKAEFKFWVGTSKYDLPNSCEWANSTVWLTIIDPLNETIVDKEVELDEFGGFADSFEFDQDAKLGYYEISLRAGKDGVWLGQGNIRLEEYKKPEFEVSVDAPKEPVKLGDSFKIKIKAQYYFGAPVQNATVKYKVERQNYSVDWFPVRPWDWFYGNGYSWFAYDYIWYPGWKKWGCFRPKSPWLPRNAYSSPEIVAQQEVPIGEDGTVEIDIDSSLAKAIFPNNDQRYSITAEVVDQSRRTIVGNGAVLVSRDPFKVYCWVDRGFYEPNQQINASFQTRQIDGKPVSGKATVKLFRIAYEPVLINKDSDNKNGDIQNDLNIINLQAKGIGLKPIETEVYAENLKINENGKANLSLAGREEGQYRLSCIVSDANGNEIEGGYIFSIRGSKKIQEMAEMASEDSVQSKTSQNTKTFHFNELELIPDKSEYEPGETVRLQINTKQADSTVVLFIRSTNSISGEPRVLSLNDSSKTVEIPVIQKDMPNFFVEAFTVSQGQVYYETKEIVIPPAKRILNVNVLPNKENYKPGEKAKAKVQITDMNGNPVVGQTVISVYDKSVEYISGGSNTEDIKEFFWKWRRSIFPSIVHNAKYLIYNQSPKNEKRMQSLGIFGDFNLFEDAPLTEENGMGGGMRNGMIAGGVAVPMMAAAPKMNKMTGAVPSESAMDDFSVNLEMSNMSERMGFDVEQEAASIVSSNLYKTDKDTGKMELPLLEATIRQNFADTAFWVADLTTDENGMAEIEFDMPENLTTWKVKVWSLGLGTKVGEGETEVITRKDLIIRMQKPRFLIQKDCVTLSANVHNYLAEEKKVQVSLEFPTLSETTQTVAESTQTESEVISSNPLLTLLNDNAVQMVTIPANNEVRVDWEVRADQIGSATLLMKALTNEESDAMQDSLPIYVHGMLKQEAISGMIEPIDSSFSDKLDVLTSESIQDSQESNEKPERSEPISESTESIESGETKVISKNSALFEIIVPDERRPEETKLTIRFSPTLAGAMIDALPYLTSYPYGCTEQTLNRFLPTILTQKVLLDNGIDLANLAEKRANLNAQELGLPEERSAQWQKSLKNRFKDEKNPIFDIEEVRKMTTQGIQKLTEMQCSDGGWGWFSGWGEKSSPHLTALVVHGLLLARECDATIDPNVIDRGINWLAQYQKEQTVKLINGRILPSKEKVDLRYYNYKDAADNNDALVYFVLTEAGRKPSEIFDLGTAVKRLNLSEADAAEMKDSTERFPIDDAMRQKLTKIKSQLLNEEANNESLVSSMMKEFLWDSRTDLSLYSLATFGLALNNEISIQPNNLSAKTQNALQQQSKSRIETILRILSQYLKQDNENQTAWLDLNSGRNWFWWSWFDSEFETQAYYLKLLVNVNPQDPVAPRMVKYLLNNRKNATYWNSTRDTALCIEAFSDYIQQTDEFQPQTTVEILFDGEVQKSVEITPENLFYIDNSLVLTGEDVSSGSHQIEIRQTGTGPIYYNAYLENFTLEDPIAKTGLEVKVERRFYRLDQDETAKVDVAGNRGQIYSQRIEKNRRTPLESFAEVQSGDLIEIELIVASKNDYESILIEDMKVAGLEAVDLQSGYNGNALNAYVEYRDERVCFFVEHLSQGTHSITYRLRAEQPGQFSALPTRIWGMYAPELKGNSDEFKLQVLDKK
ncbi:MAG: MG2 domain-containing protein [Planctomycetia bacterium]|nr:MG2 domain-containing protein [Planctomycetia bacterium]